MKRRALLIRQRGFIGGFFEGSAGAIGFRVVVVALLALSAWKAIPIYSMYVHAYKGHQVTQKIVQQAGDISARDLRERLVQAFEAKGLGKLAPRDIITVEGHGKDMTTTVAYDQAVPLFAVGGTAASLSVSFSYSESSTPREALFGMAKAAE